MRIAVWYNFPAGGAKRALYTHVDGLLRRGHHVEAWCPPTTDRSLFPLDELVTEHVTPLNYGEPPWWKPGRVAQLRSPRALKRELCAHAQVCADEMRAGRFDVCLSAICQFVNAPPLARFTSIPTALYLQEPNRWLFEAIPDFPWLGARVPKTMRERALYPGRSLLEHGRMYRRSQRARFEVDNAAAFDQLLVNSLFSRETVLRAYGLDAAVCYLGIDGELFRPRAGQREAMVAGVGNFGRLKNAHLLVDAVARLPLPRPSVEWVAANHDDLYLAEVRETARRNGVDLIVHVAATDDTLLDVLSRARALVYTPKLEPFGLVPLEANACHLPVVGVNEGGVRETVIDGVNGLLVEPDADDIAAALARILADPSFAERLGREGRRIVEERWTLDAAAARLEDALEKLVEAARALARGAGIGKD